MWALLPGPSEPAPSNSSPIEGAAVALQEHWKKVQYSSEPDPYRVAKRVFPLIVIHSLWSALVVAAHSNPWLRLKIPSLAHPLLGGVLGLLLAFRTNQAYERHWTSCKAWAEIHKTLHNMARLAWQLSQTDWDSYMCIMRHLMAFPIAMKQHLQRRQDPAEYLQILEVSEITGMFRAESPRMMILSSLSMLIRPLRLQDDGTGKKLTLWSQMEACISELQQIACNLDLIAWLPSPRSYSLHTLRFMTLWVASLPFALVHCMNPLLVVFTMMFVSWALYATEELAQLMEEPFGTTNKPATIPLDAYCKKIIVAIKQQVFVQDALDTRLASQTWVVKPEDHSPPAVHDEAPDSRAFTIE